MSKFLYSSRRNPCPVCQAIDGDCRTLTKGGNSHALYFCHTYIDPHQDPQLLFFKYLKPSQCQTWGLFVERTEEGDRRAQQREEWAEMKRRREVERWIEKRRKASSSLSLEDRDRLYRKLAAQVGITKSHREHLEQKRGLTPEQIAKGHFFSYHGGLSVPNFPKGLPGIAWFRLAGKHDGIACPAFNVHGQVIGYQVRLEDVNEGGKYRWLVGYDQDGKHSSHLPNGELPLTVVQPDVINIPHIGLSEAVLKPYIGGHHHGMTIIGASGGHHAGSPEQLREALERLLTDDPNQWIAILPDGGAVLNPNVLQRYKTTEKLLKEWGYGDRLRYGWWGQVTKADGDIDEISPDTEIQYLTPDEFGQLAWREQCWQRWRKSKQFTAEVKVEQKHFDWRNFKDGSIYLIKSGTGTGKSTNTRQWIEENRDWLRYNRVFFLGYRNKLLLQEARKIRGLVHVPELTTEEDRALLMDPYGWFALCLDSLKKFKPEDFDGAVIVLDEIVSVIKHLLYAKTEISKYRAQILLLFTEAIKRARLVICLDGHLADWVTDNFKSMCPEKTVVTVENTHQPQRPELFWLTGGINRYGELRPNDYQPLIDRVLRAATGAIAVASDSQMSLAVLDSLLTKQGKKVARVDSTTSGKDWVRALLEDPSGWLEQNRIDYLLYSPSAESGLDINITDYFTAHYCLFFGVLDVDSLLQMIARVRDVKCPKYVWTPQWSSIEGDDFSSPTAEVLQRAFNDRLNLDLNRVLGREVNAADIMGKILETYQRPLAIFEQIAFDIQGQRHWERKNLRACLLERLEATGYTITPIDPEAAESRKIYKEEREEVQQTEATAIFNAEVKPVKHLNPDKLEDQRSLRKVQLLDQLPGIEYNPIWSPDFVYTVLFKERKLLSQARRFWMLNHPEVFGRLEKEKFKRLFDRFFDDRHSLLWLEKNEWGKMWALRESGILDIVNHPDPDKVWTEDDPEIQQLLKNCKRKAIYLHLGRQGKLKPMQYVGRLLEMLGLRWSGRRSADGDRTRQYFIDRSTHIGSEWAAISYSLDRKWAKYTGTELEVIKWEPPPTYCPNPAHLNTEKSTPDDTPQPQSGSDFEPRPTEPANPIENPKSVGRENVPDNPAISTPEGMGYTAGLPFEIGAYAGMGATPDWEPLKGPVLCLSRDGSSRSFKELESFQPIWAQFDGKWEMGQVVHSPRHNNVPYFLSKSRLDCLPMGQKHLVRLLRITPDILVIPEVAVPSKSLINDQSHRVDTNSLDTNPPNLMDTDSPPIHPDDIQVGSKVRFIERRPGCPPKEGVAIVKGTGLGCDYYGSPAILLCNGDWFNVIIEYTEFWEVG